MVIVTEAVGQLANQLFEFSFLIANSIEKKYSLVNVNFGKYGKYFEKKRPQNLIIATSIFKSKFLTNKFVTFTNFVLKVLLRFNLQKSIFHKILNINTAASSGGGGESYDLNTFEFQNHAKKILFLKGAWYDDNTNFLKHNKLIKEYFTPKKEYLLKIESLFETYKKDADVVIGIHIRRGDYKEFLDGKFYFEDEIYLKNMKQMAGLFPSHKVKFLICSDQEVDKKAFMDLNIIISNQHFIVDLYSLAKCNYILGPESTFSRWASFYGNVPLYKIEKEKDNFKLSDFEVVTC